MVLTFVDPEDDTKVEVDADAEDEVELKGDTLRAGRYQFAGGSPIHSPMGTAISHNQSEVAIHEYGEKHTN